MAELMKGTMTSNHNIPDSKAKELMIRRHAIELKNVIKFMAEHYSKLSFTRN